MHIGETKKIHREVEEPVPATIFPKPEKTEQPFVLPGKPIEAPVRVPVPVGREVVTKHSKTFN